MKPKILIICSLLFALALSAGLIENKVDKAKLGMAQSMMNLSDFNQAEPILQDLYSKYPQDSNIAVNYIVILATKHNYAQAIEICQKTLKSNPENKDTKIWLARLLSWNLQYDQSIKIYDEIIQSSPDCNEARREKARVLGWNRKYEAAVAEYKEASKRNLDNQPIYYETLSKYNLYNHFDIAAEENYKNWLDREPNNSEALFDLGQIYSHQQRWTEAKKMYERVSKTAGGHLMAGQALDKVNLYSRSLKLEAGFEYFEADSAGRQMDKRYWNTFASLRKPLNENIYLKVRQDNIWRSFRDFKQIYQQQFSVGLEYFNKPYFWAALNYAGSIYQDEQGLKHTFGSQINFVPEDAWTISLSHQREQIADNSMTFLEKLYRDNYKVRVDYKPNYRIAAGADYMYSKYSDDNIRNAYGFDLAYYLSLDPKRLKLSYRYEQYGFNREDIDYFSPDSFHTNKVGLEWRQYLNKDEIFWGADDTYYTIAYDIIFDVRQQVGHKLYVDFHHDWSKNCSSHIEWSKTIYNHRDTYSEDRLMFYTTFYF